MCRKRRSQGKPGQTSRKSRVREDQTPVRFPRDKARLPAVPAVDREALDCGGDDSDHESASLLDLWEADELDDEPLPEDGDFWIERDRDSD